MTAQLLRAFSSRRPTVDNKSWLSPQPYKWLGQPKRKRVINIANDKRDKKEKRKKGKHHTMPKYLLRLRKTSFFLINRSSAISVRSNEASSKAKSTWHPIPPLKFIIDASSLKGSQCSIGARSKAWDSSGWLSPLSIPLIEVWPVFCYLAARWLSSSCSAWDLLVFATSFPFYSLFLLGLVGSSLDGKDS